MCRSFTISIFTLDEGLLYTVLRYLLVPSSSTFGSDLED